MSTRLWNASFVTLVVVILGAAVAAGLPSPRIEHHESVDPVASAPMHPVPHEKTALPSPVVDTPAPLPTPVKAKPVQTLNAPVAAPPVVTPTPVEELDGWSRDCTADEAMAEDGSCVNLHFWDDAPSQDTPAPMGEDEQVTP